MLTRVKHAFVAVLVLGTVVSAGQSGGSTGSAAALAWTGTITIRQHAAGSYKVSGNPLAIGFNADRTVTYTLNGDGTASFDARFSSTLDMGGQYSIPTRGSGSGTAYAGASYDEGWTVGADADSEIAVRTDHTAEDLWWYENFPLVVLAKEFAKAEGRSVPPPGPRVENGAVGVPGMRAASRGAANATTLSGSETETSISSQELGGLPTIPMTTTVTWNLTKRGVPPRARIYGPECGCLDADATEKTLRFIAGASPGGGEFSEFVVTSTGQMPEILSNTGGEQPSLEISGTKDTGTVTLKIRYTRNGTRIDAAPMTVTFCAIDDIELADGNEHDLSFNGNDELKVDAKAKAWRGGEDVSSELEWNLDAMGAPTSLSAEPSTKKGDHVTFKYAGLPSSNTDFGEKTLTATVGGNCACERHETIRAFFDPENNNHPGDESPNWFYYWKQTPGAPAAARPLLTFQETISLDDNPSARSIARYLHQSEKIVLAAALFTEGCRHEVDRDIHQPTGRQATGIDCFAETIRHEMQHRADAISWWGSPQGPWAVNLAEWFLKDYDHDIVPNDTETALPGCMPGTLLSSPSPTASKYTWYTCDARPFNDATDAEINAYWEGWTWPIGSIDRGDWSCGKNAKQWQGKNCGK